MFQRYISLVLILVGSTAHGQQPAAKANPTSLPGATSQVYKSAGETKLYLHLFQPITKQADEKRAAIVFFFGGGWNSGTVTQFVRQSEYLASRGDGRSGGGLPGKVAAWGDAA